MVQVIQQSDPFGKIGQAFGQGLGEQIPQEVGRHRLSSALQQFEKESAGMTPLQQLTRISTIPGITPQMIQSFGDLAKQQSKSQALIQQAQQSRERPVNPFTQEKAPEEPGMEKQAPSLTTRTPVQATLEPYIPKSFTQLQSRAGELLAQNPALYAQDPNLAMQAAVQEDAQEQARNQALQGQRTNEQNVQNLVQSSLQNQRLKLGAELPGNVYNDIENKAINAVKPKSQGGEGLTEQEAIQKYGKDLDAISRDYKAVETVGTAKLITANAKGNKDTLRSVRNKFKERNDLENFADTMIAKNKLSPSKAAYLAYPVSEQKELNNKILKLPHLTREGGIEYSGGYPKAVKGLTEEQIRAKTYEAAEKIADSMGDGSPLAIAEELQSRGYDPYAWMDYVDRNRKKLDLSERQGRELDKPRNFTPSINDMWMFYFSGLDKLVEQ